MDYAILIRHGESEANVLKILDHDPDSKYHLTQIGRGQVEFTAERISKLKVDLILSSPLLRARETAEILSKKIKVPYEVENGITEAGLGSFHGNYYASIPPLSRGKSGMETWESMRQRMLNVVEKREGTCVLVSHESPIKSLTSYFIGLLDEPSAAGIRIETASVTILDIRKHRVLTVGSFYITDTVAGQMQKTKL
jgi:broad specificity phosphatase PhoE